MLRSWIGAIPPWIALPIFIAGCVLLVLLQLWGLLLVLAIFAIARLLA